MARGPKSTAGSPAPGRRRGYGRRRHDRSLTRPVRTPSARCSAVRARVPPRPFAPRHRRLAAALRAPV